jgi:aspartate-semialdehyde dehydrogenase
MRLLTVAVLGATGEVGKALLALLAERDFPIKTLYPLASARSAGQQVVCGEHVAVVRDLAEFDFSGVDIAFFSAGGAISTRYAPKASEAGCWVIDNTACFRYEPTVPLIVPEVNVHALAGCVPGDIIANPNCSTIQMLVALKPIYDAVGISRIDVATYQAVSGAGRQAVDTLLQQTQAVLSGESVAPSSAFAHPMAFNVLPDIDVLYENGYTKEEMKMVWETQKMFEDNAIAVNATAVRVPVISGHSEAIRIQTKRPITIESAAALLSNAPGVTYLSGQDYPTPVSHGAGHDTVWVGRLRADLFDPLGLNMWVVSDNIRKGAALNAIQIAEALVNNQHSL